MQYITIRKIQGKASSGLVRSQNWVFLCGKIEDNQVR